MYGNYQCLEIKRFFFIKRSAVYAKSARRIFVFQSQKPLSKISKYKVDAATDILQSYLSAASKHQTGEVGVAAGCCKQQRNKMHLLCFNVQLSPVKFCGWFETSYWKYGLTYFGNIGLPTLNIWGPWTGATSSPLRVRPAVFPTSSVWTMPSMP